MTHYVMLGNPDIGPEDAYESHKLTGQAATEWLKKYPDWQPCGEMGKDDDVWAHIYGLSNPHGKGRGPCGELVPGDEVLVVREMQTMFNPWEYELFVRLTTQGN